MPNPDIYADFVLFNVQIVAGTVLGSNLSLCCMVDEFAATDAFPGRQKTYTGTPNQIRAALIADGFDTDAAPYKQVDAFVNNVKPIGEVVVGRIDTGEDYVDGMNAIIAEADEFFAFCVDTRNKAQQLALAAWAEQRKNKFYTFTFADPLALQGDAGSIPQLLKNLKYQFCMPIWYDPARATDYGPAVALSSAGTFRVPNGGTLLLRIDSGLEQSFTFPSAVGTLLSGTDGPYTIGAGDELELRVNNGPIVFVEFVDDPLYFPGGLANPVTATQVATYLNDKIPGLNAIADGLKIRVSTIQRGTGARIEVFDSDVGNALDLPISEHHVITGTCVPNSGDSVGLQVDSLAPLNITSGATAAADADAFAAAWAASPEHAAIGILNAVGDDVVVWFFDSATHTVTAISPATADVTPITTTNAAVNSGVSGTGFAVDADNATSTEVASQIQSTITDAAAAAVGSKFKITTTAFGSGVASIEITGGSLVDEFGLELGLIDGVGTTENYLDCQITGRIAGFDLDAPNGSTGFDNQTVPNTPGNVLTNTERHALWSRNCNTYEAVTTNRPGELHRGVVPAGFDADLVWSSYWFRVRGSERVKAMQDAKANRGERIPYNELGIAMYDNVFRGLMQDGARNGHIVGPELRDRDPQGVRTTFFHTPTMAEQTPANRAAQTFGGFASAQQAAGTAKRVIFDMTLITP